MYRQQPRFFTVPMSQPSQQCFYSYSFSVQSGHQNIYRYDPSFNYNNAQSAYTMLPNRNVRYNDPQQNQQNFLSNHPQSIFQDELPVMNVLQSMPIRQKNGRQLIEHQYGKLLSTE